MKLGATRIHVGGVASVWDSHQLRFITGGVTVDPDVVPRRNLKTGEPDPNGARIIYQGDVLGKITATGMYGPYDKNATDGREVARYLAANTYNLDSGYDELFFQDNGNGTTLGAVDMARIKRQRMSIQYSDSDLDVIKAQLSANGAFLTFVEGNGTPGPSAESIDVLPDTVSLTVGESHTLAVIWSPTNTANRHGDFTSGDIGVATVATENDIQGVSGTVTAVATGSTTITFKAANSGLTATVAVTVA
jgi:hypothetical protein